MTRDSLILHFEYLDEQEMTAEEIGIMTIAMMHYVRDGVAPEFTDRAMRMQWNSVKKRLDADADAYEERCEKNRQNILKRWGKDTNEYERIQSNTNGYEPIRSDTKNSDIDIDNDIDTDTKEKSKPKEKAPKRFSAPSLAEVREYCLERGNNVDPERFCDFYDSVGWKVGNKPMKDWKAAVRTWERREEPKARSGTTNNFKNFEERKTNLDLLEEQYFRKKYANAKV